MWFGSYNGWLLQVMRPWQDKGDKERSQDTRCRNSVGGGPRLLLIHTRLASLASVPERVTVDLEHPDRVPPITVIRPLCDALLGDVVDLLFGEPTIAPVNFD